VRTLERHVQTGGMPAQKDDQGRTLLTMPHAAHWQTRHIIARAVRKANPRMSRADIRSETYARWLEMQDGTAFDISDDEPAKKAK
jgi:hypothetical protein